MSHAATSRLPEPAGGRLLLGNSSVALALAVVVSVTLHEFSHAVAGLTSGVRPIVHHSYVDFVPEPGTAGQIITAATGPLFSLVLGALVYMAFRRAGRGFVRLLLMWLGLVSMENFFGYAVIAPFAHAGDSGTVLALLDAPGWVYIASFVVGFAGVLLLARLLAGQVLRYATDPDELRRLVLLPWLIATAFSVALDLVCFAVDASASVGVILAGSVSVAIFAPIFTFFYKRLTVPPDPLVLRAPVVPAAVLLVLAVLVVVVLAPGLPL